MASPHHHCHQPPPIPTTISTSTTCYCTTTTPPPPSIDPHLLQSLIYLLQSSQNPSPKLPCHCDPHPNRHTQHQIPHKYRTFGAPEHAHNSAAQAVLVSLVNRIDALESSLRRRDSCMYGSSAVREAAARVIQLHFRAYLVSRSRSLRHMKDLAFVKSRFNALKSSVSDQSRVDPVVMSRKTVDLLYKIDSIQDRDPMIVNGKKSLTRDLVGFLDYIDATAVKRHGVLTKAVKKVSVVQSRSDREKPCGSESNLRGVGRDRRVVIETLRGQYVDVDGDDEDVEVVSSSEEEIPYVSPQFRDQKSSGIGKGSLGDKRRPQVGGRKNVSFADDGRNRNVIDIREPKSKPTAGSSSTGDVKMILESLRKRVEEMEAGLASGARDDDSESGGSAQTSDGENRGTSSAVETDHKTSHQHPRDDDEEFTFPSPEHLKMDTQAELSNKNLKIKS